MKEKRRVLVCGASGFLGSNIFERLQQRKDLNVCGTFFSKSGFGSISNIDYANFQNKDYCLNLTRGVDTLVQCAALTAGSGRKDEWGNYSRINEQINLNLVDAAVRNGAKHFIFLSCSVMYPTNLNHPVKEEDVDEDGIASIYLQGAVGKLNSERRMWAESFGDTSFTVVRHSNIYGPRDKFDLQNSHVLAATIQKAMTSQNGQLNMHGNMNIVRDLLYVSDFVDFIEDSVVFGPREKFIIFNVGAGNGVSISELARKIIKISEKNLRIVLELEKHMAYMVPTSIVLDIKKARNIMGWKPVVSLGEGIRKTIEWWKENYEQKS